MSRRRKLVLSITVSSIMALISIRGAQAFGSFLTQFNNTYPDSQSGNNAPCQLCHADAGGGEPYTGYGWDMIQNGNNYTAIESLDSDGDGNSNLDEINADAQPGWCDPATPGCTNTAYFTNGNTEPASPPTGILLDPAGPTPTSTVTPVPPTPTNTPVPPTATATASGATATPTNTPAPATATATAEGPTATPTDTPIPPTPTATDTGGGATATPTDTPVPPTPTTTPVGYVEYRVHFPLIVQGR